MSNAPFCSTCGQWGDWCSCPLPGENIARIVTRALDTALENGYDPREMTASANTYDLLDYEAELEGASFDDVYPNVMAWLTTKGAQ